MKMKSLFLAVVVLAFMAAIVIAAPYGPRDIKIVSNDRRTEFNESVASHNALAGNTTLMIINTSVLTESWQGYYGNITGIVTLDDAAGNTMYQWGGAIFTPDGEVYAANYTVADWTRVVCVNLTGDGTPAQDGPNTTVLEDAYGMDTSDSDGVDETFTTVYNITVGGNSLFNCPATNIYDNSGSSTDWNETLLWENHTDSLTTVIFAAQVANDKTGFDGNTQDFQMIVGENGHSGDTSTTAYYFYVELA